MPVGARVLAGLPSFAACARLSPSPAHSSLSPGRRNRLDKLNHERPRRECSAMYPEPHERDWSQAHHTLRTNSPLHRQFNFVLAEFRETFCEIARAQHPRLTRTNTESTSEQRLASKRARAEAVRAAEAAFSAWYEPLQRATMETHAWTKLFWPSFRHGGDDNRKKAIAELDGWYKYVKANPNTYPSPASLPPLTDSEAFPIIAAALSSAAKQDKQVTSTEEEDRYPSQPSQHSLAASHRRISHRQQAIYGISQRSFARAGCTVIESNAPSSGVSFILPPQVAQLEPNLLRPQLGGQSLPLPPRADLEEPLSNDAGHCKRPIPFASVVRSVWELGDMVGEYELMRSGRRVKAMGTIEAGRRRCRRSTLAVLSSSSLPPASYCYCLARCTVRLSHSACGQKIPTQRWLSSLVFLLASLPSLPPSSRLLLLRGLAKPPKSPPAPTRACAYLPLFFHSLPFPQLLHGSTMPAPHYRDWSQATVELRGGHGHNPARLRFEAIMDEMRTWFRARATTLPKPMKKGVSRKALADDEFFAWNKPFFHDVGSETEWKGLFVTHVGGDKRAKAVAELDGWFQYVKEHEEEYPSPASLPRLTDHKAFPIIAAALASIGIIHHEPIMLTEEDRYLQQQHSLAVSHRRLSHRQQAIYGISQRSFARAGF
ncbi:Proteophosphoglycan ppg4 [Rhodotorula toruloides ATCC 204091]|uniref:Proteophosphoglycan ppg4 n=1 Tax=Rhodotorula toruloides TaxID=5286 RepID=A0A2T0AIM0_RHOTO|nr:Proteophosphoglycan ppg4 [Rhodotorula toruloides ATCC 204091]PRQ77867.1 Proteophosphoglycan ppg4 [Rhodotorula toruloides]